MYSLYLSKNLMKKYQYNHLNRDSNCQKDTSTKNILLNSNESKTSNPRRLIINL